MTALTTKMKIPKVRIIRGAASSSRIGRRKAFNIPRSRAAATKAPKLSYRMPLISQAATMTATVVIAQRKTKSFIARSIGQGLVHTDFRLHRFALRVQACRRKGKVNGEKFK